MLRRSLSIILVVTPMFAFTAGQKSYEAKRGARPTTARGVASTAIKATAADRARASMPSVGSSKSSVANGMNAIAMAKRPTANKPAAKPVGNPVQSEEAQARVASMMAKVKGLEERRAAIAAAKLAAEKQA